MLLDTSSTVHAVAIRGGRDASINFAGDLLVTRESSNPTFVRRTLIDLDTLSTIPSGTSVQSAILTVTTHWAGAAPVRRIGVFPVLTPFTTGEATWDTASAQKAWERPGGDLGPRATTSEISNIAGAHASFDVTGLVQAAIVAGTATRLALVDLDSVSTGRAGYHDYYPVDTPDASQRPQLLVTLGATGVPVALPNFSHVFTLIFENHEFSDIIGNPAAPYFNALANRYGLATNYEGVMHPSLPNYMALTGGETVFTTDCRGCTTSAPSVVDQVERSGRSWRAYMETMPAPCTTTDFGAYVQKHNPFVHYSGIVDHATRCASHVIAKTPLLADLQHGDVADYTWVSPNICNDMHSCSVATGDAWLKKYATAILASPAWDARSVIFIVFDEGTSATGGGGRTATIVVSARTPARTRSAKAYTHYNLLATIEDAWHLPRLGRAAGVAAMTDMFK